MSKAPKGYTERFSSAGSTRRANNARVDRDTHNRRAATAALKDHLDSPKLDFDKRNKYDRLSTKATESSVEVTEQRRKARKK